MSFGWFSSSKPKLPSTGNSNDDQSIERIGQKYFKNLLKHINIMLDYVNENGIVVPDDLRKDITELFTDANAAAVTVTAKTEVVTPAQTTSTTITDKNKGAV